jgi:hypothetical protein
MQPVPAAVMACLRRDHINKKDKKREQKRKRRRK